MTVRGRYDELESWQKKLLRSAAIEQDWLLYWRYKRAFLYYNEKKKVKNIE